MSNWRTLVYDDARMTEEALNRYAVDFRRGYLVEMPFARQFIGSLCIPFSKDSLEALKRSYDALKERGARFLLWNGKHESAYFRGDENEAIARSFGRIGEKRQKDCIDRGLERLPLCLCDCQWYCAGQTALAQCVYYGTDSIDYDMMNYADVCEAKCECFGEGSGWQRYLLEACAFRNQPLV